MADAASPTSPGHAAGPVWCSGPPAWTVEQNRAPLDEVASLPRRTDLVVLPEAFARDFGEPGSDLAPFAETLDGPFAARLRQLSTSTGSAWLAGMFEVSGPTPPGR